MFRIKICGITSVADGLCVARSGADAVGLNFCPSSPRKIDIRLAEEIVAALPGHIARVGVFVNAPAAEVGGIAPVCSFTTCSFMVTKPRSIWPNSPGCRSSVRFVEPTIFGQ